MKRIFTLILLILFASSFSVEAANVQRKRSSGKKSTSTMIATQYSTIYDIDVVVTANGGYACIFDSSDLDNTGDTEIIEIRDATQYNSKHKSFGESGIKVHKGISLFLNNATATISYY